MTFRDVIFPHLLPTFFLSLELVLCNLFHLDSGVELVDIAILCIRTQRIKQSYLSKYEHIYFMTQWPIVIYCFSVLASNFVYSRVDV